MDEGTCTFRYYNGSARKKSVLMTWCALQAVSATMKPTRKEQEITNAPEDPTVRTQHKLWTFHRGHGTISSELLPKNLASNHTLSTLSGDEVALTKYKRYPSTRVPHPVCIL